MTTTKLDNTARAHLAAGHSVDAFYPTDTAGHLALVPGVDELDIYDTESLDAGATEEVRCQTCDQELELTPDIP